MSSFLVLAGTYGFAQSTSADDTSLAAEIDGPSDIALWKTGDADTTIYMMGTIHMLPPDIAWETEEFQEAWEESDTLFLEADVISPEAQQALSTAVLGNAFFTDGTKLSSFFTAEELSNIDKAIAPLNLSFSLFENMRPWFASINIAQVALQQMGADPMSGVDFILHGRATEEGKSIRFLETGTEQIEIIAGVPDKEWAASMAVSIEELSDMEAFFADMVRLWYTGDAESLAQFMNTALEATPELKISLLDQRNENWARQLDRLISKEEGVFFMAVGAGHLAGDNTVQDYLLELGHQTSRVNP